MIKHYSIFILLFQFLACGSEKENSASCNSKGRQPESCDGKTSFPLELAATFQPQALPVSFTYGLQNGLSVSLSDPVLSTPYGTLTLSGTFPTGSSEHNVTIVLKYRDNTTNSLTSATYYLENTDHVKAKISHPAVEGYATIEQYEDQLTIDITNDDSAHIEFYVNNIYYPNPDRKGKACRVETNAGEDGLLNFRFDPGKEGDIIQTIKNHETVEFLGGEKRIGQSKWVEVCYENKKGWINSRLLECY